MGVDQVAINRGRNSFSCFLPPRLSGGPEDGRQANLAGTVLPHKWAHPSISLYIQKHSAATGHPPTNLEWGVQGKGARPPLWQGGLHHSSVQGRTRCCRWAWKQFQHCSSQGSRVLRVSSKSSSVKTDCLWSGATYLALRCSLCIPFSFSSGGEVQYPWWTDHHLCLWLVRHKSRAGWQSGRCVGSWLLCCSQLWRSASLRRPTQDTRSQLSLQASWDWQLESRDESSEMTVEYLMQVSTASLGVWHQ